MAKETFDAQCAREVVEVEKLIEIASSTWEDVSAGAGGSGVPTVPLVPSKRTKSEPSKKRIYSVDSSDEDGGGGAQEVEDVSDASSLRSKRGWKTIIPEHEGMFTAEKRRERARMVDNRRREEKEARTREFLKAPGAFSSTRLAKTLKEEADLKKVYRHHTAEDLAATIGEGVLRICKVASKTNDIGLQGQVGKMLWELSAEIAAASTALAIKASPRGEEAPSDAEELRAEMLSLRIQNGELRKELEEMREKVKGLENKCALQALAEMAVASTRPPPHKVEDIVIPEGGGGGMIHPSSYSPPR